MSTSADTILTAPLGRSLVARAQAILLRPRVEWPVIAEEQATTASLYAGYIAPLAAIPPLAGLIGMSVFGLQLPYGGSYRTPLGAAITSAVVQYLLGLVMVYLLARIIEALAPSFGGHPDRLQALKVSAYASTASWLVGIVALVPALGILSILGLYSLYLIYLGLPPLMKAPPERAAAYAGTVIVCAIGLVVVTWTIASRFIAYPSLLLPVR